jgi:hypothetical protein
MQLFGLSSPVVGAPRFRPVVLRDGVEVFVNDRATGKGASEFRTCELAFHSDRLAEVRPAWTYKAVSFCSLLLGLFVMVVSLAHLFDARPDRVVFGCLAGGFFAVPGLLILLGIVGPKRVYFDLDQGVVAIPQGGAPIPELQAGLPLSRLAALQLCYWIQHATRRRGKHSREHYTYTMFELNAVLVGGNGERFVLMTDNDVARLERQAKQLSHMLGLPLIDSITSIRG